MVCFFQAEDGIRDLVRSRGLGDVYKRQVYAVLLLLATSILVVIMGTKAAPTGPSSDQIAEPWAQSPLPVEPVSYTHLTLPTSDLV